MAKRKRSAADEINDAFAAKVDVAKVEKYGGETETRFDLFGGNSPYGEKETGDARR
jgi:hypothetical protein